MLRLFDPIVIVKYESLSDQHYPAKRVYDASDTNSANTRCEGRRDVELDVQPSSCGYAGK